MSIELKIKSKHLSAEAKIIRHEENKLKRQIQWLKEHQQPHADKSDTLSSISGHRRWEVRNENRATFLARAFIADVPYKTLEQSCHDSGIIKNAIHPAILRMVLRYDKRYNNFPYHPETEKQKHIVQVSKKITEWIGI